MTTTEVVAGDDQTNQSARTSMLKADEQPPNLKNHPRYDPFPRCISAFYICWYTIVFGLSLFGLCAGIAYGSDMCDDEEGLFTVPLNTWLQAGCIPMLILSIAFLSGYCFLRCCSTLSLFDRVQRILWSSITTAAHCILSIFFTIWSILGLIMYTGQMTDDCQASEIGNAVLLLSVFHLLNLCFFCCCAPIINCYGTLKCLQCCMYCPKRNGEFRMSKEQVIEYCPECADEEYLKAHPYVNVIDLDKMPSLKFRQMDLGAHMNTYNTAKGLKDGGSLNDLLNAWRNMFIYSYSYAFIKQPPLKHNTVIDNLYLNEDLRFAVIAHESASIDKGVILYTHGGGYIAGSHRDDLPMLSFLSELTGCVAISIDYKLCPEYSLMACVYDGVNMYKWLCDVDGVRTQNHGNVSSHCPAWLLDVDGNEMYKRCVFAGDSAGGGLCLRLLQAVNADDSMQLPCCGWAISPWTKLPGFNKRDNKELDALVAKISIDGIAKICAGNFEKEKNTLITEASFGDLDDGKYSPFNADVKGLCPIYISIGGTEKFLDDALMFAEKAYKEGVEVELEIEPYMFHIWPTFATSFPEAKESITRASEFIKRQLQKQK